MIAHITVFAVSEFLVAISAIVIGLSVYLRDRTRPDFSLWLFFNISIATYGFFGGAASLTLNRPLALSLLRVELALGVLWIPVFFLHFIHLYCRLHRSKELSAVYIITSAIAVLTFTPLFYKDVRLAFGSFYYGVPGSAAFVLFYIGWWLFLFARGLMLLFRFMKRTDAVTANKTKYMLVGVATGALGGSLGFLPIFNIDIYPWGNFAVPVYTVLMSYAIVRHQLLDISIVLKRALVYSALVFVIAAIYFFGVYIFYKFMLSQVIPRQSVEVGIVTILLVALLFKPLEMLLNRALEKSLYRGTISQLSNKNAVLQTELEKRERLKSVGIMAAGMAHEIKNPITAIKTFANYLPLKYNEPSFREQFARIVGQELGRIESIVKDLLSFSKPAEPNVVDFELDPLLTDQLDLMNSIFLSKNIRTKFSSVGPKVKGDPGQIKQAFLNIILNASDAMGEKGGVLGVSVTSSGRTVLLAIQDSGCGIPQDKLKHIFDPFYTDKPSGTGLGLAICHSLIEKNGGWIDVKSQENRGTTFTIHLISA